MFLNKFTESSLPIYAYLICKRLRRGLKNLMYSYYTLKQLFFYKFEDEYCPLLIHCSNHCWFMNRFLWKKSSSAKELIFFKKGSKIYYKSMKNHETSIQKNSKNSSSILRFQENLKNPQGINYNRGKESMLHITLSSLFTDHYPRVIIDCTGSKSLKDG